MAFFHWSVALFLVIICLEYAVLPMIYCLRRLTGKGLTKRRLLLMAMHYVDTAQWNTGVVLVEGKEIGEQTSDDADVYFESKAVRIRQGRVVEII